MQDYTLIKDEYRNFSRDVTILIEFDRLLTTSGLEDLRSLQLDVSLADGVAQAISIFSTPDFDPQTGEPVDWFPDEFGDDAHMIGLIDRLIEKYPQAASLFSKEKRTAVIIASLVTGVQEDDAKSFLAYQDLRNIAEEFAPDDFKLSFTGLTPVGAAILDALISDQKADDYRVVAWDRNRLLHLPKPCRSDAVRHTAGIDSALGIWSFRDF